MDQSQFVESINEALEELVEKKLHYTKQGIDRHISNATQSAVMKCVGDNTYVSILKRLEVLEMMCLEHRADWAEARLRALEKAVKELCGGEGPEANRRSYVDDELPRSYVPSDIDSAFKENLRKNGQYQHQDGCPFDNGSDSSDQDPVLRADDDGAER